MWLGHGILSILEVSRERLYSEVMWYVENDMQGIKIGKYDGDVVLLFNPGNLCTKLREKLVSCDSFIKRTTWNPTNWVHFNWDFKSKVRKTFECKNWRSKTECSRQVFWWIYMKGMDNIPLRLVKDVLWMWRLPNSLPCSD